MTALPHICSDFTSSTLTAVCNAALSPTIQSTSFFATTRRRTERDRHVIDVEELKPNDLDDIMLFSPYCWTWNIQLMTYII